MATAKQRREAKKALPDHDTRQRIIHAAMPHVRYIEHKTWAGTMTHREHIPTEGHKSFSPTPEDEECATIHLKEEEW